MKWLVRVVVFGGLGLLLLIAAGGRIRADRALDRVDEIRGRGVPSEIVARAGQMVSQWAGQPAVVVDVEQRTNGFWLATAMVGPVCYEVFVGPGGDMVSAHPGQMPCPPVSVAGSGDDKLEANDPRHTLVSLFLDSWLRGDPTAGRFLADSTADIAPPAEVASDVKVMAVYGDNASPVDGARSTVTAEAEAELDGRTEALAWTFRLVHGPTRWSIAAVAGGEVPTGDPATLVLGRTPNTTPIIPSQGD